MEIKNYKDLIVWQKSMELVVEVYVLTALLPKSEMYGLCSQMNRAGVSIPSNIAEGFNRKHDGEQLQFYAISYASGAELETQLEICIRLNFFISEQTKKAASLLNEVMRMLNKLTTH